MSEPLLRVRDLTTVFVGPRGPIRAADGVTFSIRSGETLGLVGESGSGKSATALSIMRLVAPPGRIAGGSVEFKGRNLLILPEREMRRVRGAEIGFVFQEPMTALDPVFTIGSQIAETLRVHRRASRRDARRRAIELLDLVKVPEPHRRVDDYPHQLSGGLRQRALIAIALACRPSLVIADEPTTALDVTIQAQILDLLRDMRRQFGLSLLLITHDFGIVAELADRVLVMYAGRIVEEAPVREIFSAPKHPYTRGLLASIPGTDRLPASRTVSSGRDGTTRSAKRLRAIEGAVPPLAELPPGCAFAPRCPERMSRCDLEPPAPVSIRREHTVRCHLYPPIDD